MTCLGSSVSSATLGSSSGGLSVVCLGEVTDGGCRVDDVRSVRYEDVMAILTSVGFYGLSVYVIDVGRIGRYGFSEVYSKCLLCGECWVLLDADPGCGIAMFTV